MLPYLFISIPNSLNHLTRASLLSYRIVVRNATHQRTDHALSAGAHSLRDLENVQISPALDLTNRIESCDQNPRGTRTVFTLDYDWSTRLLLLTPLNQLSHLEQSLQTVRCGSKLSLFGPIKKCHKCELMWLFLLRVNQSQFVEEREVLIAALNSIGQIKSGGNLDIFQIAKRMRSCRQCMISSLVSCIPYDNTVTKERCTC